MLRALRELNLTNPVAFYRALRNAAITVWDPTRSDIQGGIQTLVYDALRKAPPKQVADLAAASPALVSLFEAGYDPVLDPERLERLPDGTLGREYARFIRANGLTPLETLLAMPPATNVLEYLFRRAYKLHDVLHVAIGADASVLGEVRVVSYTIGQSRRQGHAAPLALAVLWVNIALRRPYEMPEAIALAAEWLERGRSARWHVTTPLEDWLEKPVPEVREALLAPA